MKKLMLFSVMYFMLSIVNAQELNFGLANLKLYSSLDLINSIGFNEKTPKIKNYSDYINYIEYKKDLIVYEVVNDSTSDDNYNGYFNPDVRYFIIPKYRLINELYINELELIFYKNKLIKFSSKCSSELNEALNIKYGKADVKVEHKDKVFTFVNTGAKITKTEDTYYSTWDVNSLEIKCSSMLWKYYDDNGKEKYINDFEFYDIKLMKEVSEQEDIINKRIRDRENEAKKSSLKGL